MSYSEEQETSYVSVGPWGGQSGGVRWDDGVYSSIRLVMITHSNQIDSIQIEYDKRGASWWSQKHGTNFGSKSDKVKLDYPHEYLVSIGGHYGSVTEYGPVVIRSLLFQSNRKSYGPFGIQQGTQFSFPTTGAKVVGFHGRSSANLEAIGVHIKPLLHKKLTNNSNVSQGYTSNKITEKNNVYEVEIEGIDTKDKMLVTADEAGEGSPDMKQIVSYGPWGGNGGMIFDDGVYTGVFEIQLTRYGGIASIRACYDCHGKAVWGNKNGGSGGIRVDKISFDYPNEILTHITGFYGSTILRGPTVVKSLTFHTNKKKHGPFGEEQGIPFSSGSNGGIIVGFHGRRGWFVDSIGVHVRKVKLQPSLLSYDSFNVNDINTYDGMAKEVAPLAPWGGAGGTSWNDGVFSGIKKIYLVKREAIHCIQIEYDKRGQSVWSARHGGGSEGDSNLIKLDYPGEFLTSMSGYYSPLNGDERTTVIKSLTFCSNKGKYGPFGEEKGTFFCSKEGKIVGFHGRNNGYLTAIGVHMHPFSTDTTQHCSLDKAGPVKTLFVKFFHS